MLWKLKVVFGNLYLSGTIFASEKQRNMKAKTKKESTQAQLFTPKLSSPKKKINTNKPIAAGFENSG